MRERAINLRDWEVRAILDGRKTQTRRPVQSPAKNMQREGMEVIKRRAPGDRWYGDHVWSMRGPTGVWGDYTDDRFRSLCPFGVPGDLLWVRETFHRCPHCELEPIAYRADDTRHRSRKCEAHGWIPSIHMPRCVSRLTLRVTDVRVERVQDISEDDARAEGVRADNAAVVIDADGKIRNDLSHTHRGAFAAAWDAVYGKRDPTTPTSWTANPWVWVVSFERAEVRRG